MQRSIPRVVRRGDVFYFRMAVPKHLVSKIGRSEIKVSLRSCDRKFSNVVGRTVSNALDVLFSELSRMQQGSSDIHGRVRAYFQDYLEKAQELAHDLPQDSDYDPEEEVAGLQAQVEGLRASCRNRVFNQAIQAEARILAGPDAGLDVLQYACELVARAKIEHLRIYQAQLAGRYDDLAPRDPLFVGQRATGRLLSSGDPGASPASSLTLAGAIDRYYQFKGKHWVPKTLADQKRVMALAAILIGSEKPMHALDVEDVKKVRDALAQLPPNYIKLAANQGRSLQDIIAENKTGQVLSRKTQDKYLVMFKQLLIWAVNEGYIEKVPGKGVTVAGVGKTNPAEQRDPYSTEQLAAIFKSPLYTGHCSQLTRHKPGKIILRDGKFWVPLIALFSGLRVGEIIQLSRTDVRESDGVVYFDVNDGDGKQVKTLSSKRRVPVHAALIEIGFLKFVQSVKHDARIFSDIEPGQDGSFSHNFSKWWGRYSRQVGFRSQKTAFHSFRHCFRDALAAAEVSETLSRALMGHADRSVHNQYGSGPNLKALKAAIDQVKYPVDLTFLLPN